MQKSSSSRSKVSAFIDLLIIFIPFGILLIAQEAISNELYSTLGRALLIGLTVLLIFLRGGGWRTVGLNRPANMIKTILLGFALMVIGIIIGVSVQEILLRLPGIRLAEPDFSRVAKVEGNLPLLLISLARIWTTVAFGEELVWRGFLMNRLESIFGEGRVQTALVVLISAVMFGLAHFYQGVLGIILTGVLGLIYMLAYRLSGRNLWVVIIGHGLTDTLTLISIYAGRL